MPGGGDTVAKRLACAGGARVCVFTANTDGSIAAEALRAGAAGYLVKTSASMHLARAIRAIANGETYVETNGSTELHERPRGDPLSPREVEVLRLVARGFTNREVGDALGIGIKSAETYRLRVCKKLGARSRAELVRAAIDTGVLPPTAE